MNLLSLLLKSLLTDSSISALAKKTGLNASSLKKLIPLAIPLLLKFLTKNASNESGALSLLGALSQHTNQKALSDQIDEDGGKIINHIFGSESEDVTNQLALESGMSQRDVSSALAGIAPALMSGLSAATNSVSSAPKVDLSDGLDLSDLMGMFVGTQQAQQAQNQPSGGGLLSGLLGGNNAGLGGLFGSLFGSSAPQASQENEFNGTQLLSLLSSMRR